MHHVRGPVFCPANIVGTPLQIIKITQWGVGSTGYGPTGYKLKPARMRARSMAEMVRREKAKRKGSPKK